MIRLLAIWIMKNRLKKAKIDQIKSDNYIIKSAYNSMIENYKYTILYLESNRK